MPLGLRRHVGLLIGWPTLGMRAGSLGRVGLPCVGCGPTLLPWWGLGVGCLLLSRMGSLALCAVVWTLALGAITSWSLLSVGRHLLPIWHASHSPAALHSHWISVGARGSVALARVTGPLLCPWRRALLRVRAAPSI